MGSPPQEVPHALQQRLEDSQLSVLHPPDSVSHDPLVEHEADITRLLSVVSCQSWPHTLLPTCQRGSDHVSPHAAHLLADCHLRCTSKPTSWYL